MQLIRIQSVFSVPVMKRQRVKFAKNAKAPGKKKKKKDFMMMSLVVLDMISYLIIVWFSISLSRLVL